MTDVIRVDYEGLQKIAAAFGKESESITQILQQVRGSLNPLQSGGWMGQGSEAFFSEMEKDILPAVQRLQAALGEANQVTNQIINFMQQADEEASAGFRSGGAAAGLVNLGSMEGAGGITGIGGNQPNLDGLEGLISGSGFGGSGFGGSGSLSSSIFGSDLFGGTLGSGLFGSDLFGSGSLGYGLNSNDFGIPQDWLSGVTDSLNGYIGDNYNDYGIPQDWLDDVMGSRGVSGESLASGASGGSSGGGSAGSGGSLEPTEPQQTEPTSSGGGSSGGSSPTSDIRDPYGRATIPGDYRGYGGTAAASETTEAAGLRYQSLGAMSGGAGGSSTVPTTAGIAAASPTVAATADTGKQSGLGLSLGLAAASPFVALLGKAIKNSRDDD